MDYRALYNAHQQAQELAEEVKKTTPPLDPFIMSQLARSKELHKTVIKTIEPYMEAITLVKDQLKGAEKEIEYI